MTVRIYTPTTPTPAAGQKKELEPLLLPVGVYYHGGGYISGDLDFEDPIYRIISEKTPCVLVSVDYRLAPKYESSRRGSRMDTMRFFGFVSSPIIAIILNIMLVYLLYAKLGIQAHANASSLNGDPAAYFTIGGSAGGGIALAVTDKLIRNGKRHLVQGTGVLNPITTHMDNPPERYRGMYTSYTEYAANNNAAVIDRHCMDVSFGIFFSFFFMSGIYKYSYCICTVCADLFTGVQNKKNPGSSAAHPTDSTIFVTLSRHLSSYPPVYIATCEKDILRDDGVVLERALGDAGVKRVKRDHYVGFPHYFFVFPSVKTGRTFILNVVRGVRFVLGLEEWVDRLLELN